MDPIIPMFSFILIQTRKAITRFKRILRRFLTISKTVCEEVAEQPHALGPGGEEAAGAEVAPPVSAAAVGTEDAGGEEGGGDEGGEGGDGGASSEESAKGVA